MGEQLIAKRYARGLYLSTNSDRVKAKSYQDVLVALAELCEHSDIFKFFKNPSIAPKLKLEVLEGAVKQFQPDAGFVNFLKTLSESGRLAELPKISSEFNSLILASDGVLKATLITAAEITEQDRKDIKINLEERFKRKIELEMKIDKNILGGFVVRIGNNIIDLSLKSKLDKIARVAVS